MPFDESSNTFSPYVSTGHLPDQDTVTQLIQEAHQHFGQNHEGVVSKFYPALERVPPALYGICMVGTNGAVQAAGDVDY